MPLTDDQIIEQLLSDGYSDDEIVEALTHSSGSVNQQEPLKPPDPRDDPSNYKMGSFGKLISDNVFPSASQIPETPGIGDSAKRVGLGVLDALSFPTRALAHVTGQGKMSESDAMLLRKPVDYVNEKIDQTNAPELVKNITKGGVELAGNMLSDPFLLKGLASGIVKGAFKGSNKLLGRTASELSNISEEALRTYGTGIGKGSKALKAAAGTERKIADKLVDVIDNFDDYIPEKQIIDKALGNMPPMNFNKVYKTMDNVQVIGGTETALKANAKIKRLKNLWKGIGPIPAKKFREIRTQLDNEIKSAFSKDVGTAEIIEKQLMKVRKAMKESLEDAALKSGNPEYIKAMKTYSDKLEKLEEIKGYLGKNSSTRERRVEAFVDNLFGKNKTNAQKVLNDLSEIVGADFVQDAKLAQLAQEFGPTGKPGLLPTHTTGRSTLGLGAGGTMLVSGAKTGNIPLALAGAGTVGLTSPKIAATTLGSLDALASLGNKVAPYTKAGFPISGAAAGVSNIINENEKKKNRWY